MNDGHCWGEPEQVCVSMLGLTTCHKFQMSAFQMFHDGRYREGQWRATVRVQHRRPGAKTTEVETCMAACVGFFFISYFIY